MKNNRDKKKLVKTLLCLSAIILLIIAINVGIIGGNSYKNTVYKNSDKLKVSTPIFINSDNKDSISNKSIKVEIENTSKDTIYDIYIDIDLISSNEDNVYYEERFALDQLSSGQSAVLTNMVDDVDIEQKLKIKAYYYTNSKGESFEVTKVENHKDGKFMIKSYDNEEFNPLTNDIDRIRISNIKDTIKDNKKEYEFEVKNISNEKLEAINISFQETDNNVVVKSVDVEEIGKLNKDESTTIKVISSKDKELELSKYTYFIVREDKNPKMNECYYVYPKSNIYSFFEYEDLEEMSTRNNIIIILNLVIIITCNQIDRISKKLNESGIKENDKIKIKKGKKLKIISWTIIIIYFSILLYFIVVK